MRIGIVGGTGKEGVGLGLRWAQAGHEVIIGSRDPERARAKAAELAASHARQPGGRQVEPGSGGRRRRGRADRAGHGSRRPRSPSCATSAAARSW